jgi:FKBP-type peptidyl-prolyl cis-trans isomerase
MVIEGWQEGIPLLSEGASAIMILPPTIAYGSNSPSAIIPPNSTLVFEVTLNAIL